MGLGEKEAFGMITLVREYRRKFEDEAGEA